MVLSRWAKNSVPRLYRELNFQLVNRPVTFCIHQRLIKCSSVFGNTVESQKNKNCVGSFKVTVFKRSFSSKIPESLADEHQDKEPKQEVSAPVQVDSQDPKVKIGYMIRKRNARAKNSKSRQSLTSSDTVLSTVTDDINNSSKSDFSSKALPTHKPENVFSLALYRRPAFPGFYQILQIADLEIIKFLKSIKEQGDGLVGGFLTKAELPPEEPTVGSETSFLRKDAGKVAGLADMYEVGTLLSIVNITFHNNVTGGQVIVMPQRRIRVKSLVLNRLGQLPAFESSSTSLGQVDTLKSELTPQQEQTDRIGLGETTALLRHVRSDTDAFQPPSTTQFETSLSPSDNDINVSSIGGSQAKSVQTAPGHVLETQPGLNRLLGGKGADLSVRINENESDQPENELTRNVYPLHYISVEYSDEETSLRFDANDTLKAYHCEIVATMKELLKSSYFYKEHFDQVVKFYNLDYASKLADLVAGMSFAKRDELQAVIQEKSVERRLQLTLDIIKKDLEFSRLQLRVKSEVEEKLLKEQKKYVLNEQLKFIKKELGIEKDDKQTLLQSFRDVLDTKPVSEDARKAIEMELGRLSLLESSSAEYNICRSYLEWLTQLPWGVVTSDNCDIKKAAEALDSEHYGLQDVKDRLLEFMAVNILRKDVQGKIICLVGPPGVGKTSIGMSIAKALDRKFYRFSLGGLNDTAELRGHRRTYVSAMPGKFVQALKQTGAFNPLILLDEIDKFGKDFRGDPASVLLEVLDPNQNKTFRDYYLDIPLDLSKVLFLCTANTTDTISGPLLDRMEIVRLAGYLHEEKIRIAEKHLIPQITEDTALGTERISITSEVLHKLAKDYAREAGVRGLQKHLEKIFRKVALQIVREETAYEKIDLDNLTKYVGQPLFQSERLYPITPPGVVMGLAWTQMGGATLFVEAQGRYLDFKDNMDSDSAESSDSENDNEQKKGSIRKRMNVTSTGRSGTFRTTGHLGGVMSESCQIALSAAKYFLSAYDSSNKYLDQAQIHLHIPEGATPKDGPSAGITMAAALISLALNKSVIPDLAMTGELTLTGKVLKIGGVKEKVIAAKRENVKILIFPMENFQDFGELSQDMKAGLNVYFIDCLDDLFKIAFPELNSAVGQYSLAAQIPHKSVIEISAPI